MAEDEPAEHLRRCLLFHFLSWFNTPKRNCGVNSGRFASALNRYLRRFFQDFSTFQELTICKAALKIINRFRILNVKHYLNIYNGGSRKYSESVHTQGDGDSLIGDTL